MKLPDPVPGLVIRYNYLWSDDKAKGLYEGGKDRPCVIVIASKQTGAMTVVPVTHSHPAAGEEALSIDVPAGIARQIGLDEAPNYIRLEVNRFEWPGDHLRRLPNDPSRVDYGMVPREFFEEIRKRLVELVRANVLRQSKR